MNTNYSKNETAVEFDNSVVIRKYINGIVGGRTLDCTGFTAGTILKAGHVIIKLASGNYAPMPLTTSGSSTVYDSLPSGASYAGILFRSISVDKPEASIMTNGEVNLSAVPYAMSSILSAFKSACPFIAWASDEDSNNPFTVADTAKVIAAAASGTTTISGHIGTVTGTCANDKITATVSGTVVTIAVASGATAGGTVILTDAAGQTASVVVTLS